MTSDEKMSQDDIAALLASMNAQPEAKVEAELILTPEPEAASDPGKQMSQDDIAALLASMNAQPEAKVEAEPILTPEPEAASDPGKQMSQDDVAALLASMNTEPEIKAETEPILTPEPEAALDPDKQIGQDEIEVLLTSGNTQTDAMSDPEPILESQPDLKPEQSLVQPSEVAHQVKSTAAGQLAFLAIVFAGIEAITAKIKTMLFKYHTTDKTSVDTVPYALPKLAAFTEKLSNKVSAKALAIVGGLLLPLAVGTGVYLGVIANQDQLAALNLPERQLARSGVAYSEEEFVKYAGRGDKLITELFLASGMSPDSYRKNDGYTALIAAASYGRANVVKLLLEKGANTDDVDKDGQTAAMKAVYYNQADVVATLIQYGANLNIQDKHGHTVISLAKEKNDRRVLDVLLKAGIKEVADMAAKNTLPSKSDKKLSEIKSVASGKLATPVANNTGNQAAKAVIPSGSATEYGLLNGQAGYAEIGKSVDTLYQRYGNSLIVEQEYVEGKPYKVIKLYSGTHTTSLAVNFIQDKQDKTKTIAAIRVYDERYKLPSGIGVSSALGDLRRAGLFGSIQLSGDSLYVLAKDARMKFELDFNANSMPSEWLNGGDLNSLPDSMKISSILLY